MSVVPGWAARKATENTVESHLTTWVKKVKWMNVKLQLLPGWPDRLILVRGGTVFFAECKRPKGGVFEKLQPRVHEKLRAFGFRVYVPHTKEEVDAMFLEEMRRAVA